MEVTPVKTYTDIESILEMAKNHPAPEYDCTFEYFASFVRQIITKPNVGAWIIWDGDKPAGYTIGVRITGLNNQINVFDIYLNPEYRGQHLVLMLTDKLKEWAVKEGAKRIVWTSKWPREAWAKLLNLDVAEQYTYMWENK